jgi:hypothetical protein
MPGRGPENRIRRERRKGERRKKVDPRYRNPNYPEFVDRRSGKDRRQTDAKPPESSLFSQEAGRGGRALMVGAVAAIFLLYLAALGICRVFNVCRLY